MPEKLKGAKMVRSFCHVCPFRCPIEVYVKDGKVIYSKGNTEAPNTRGKRCVKGLASIYFTYDPDRLKYPLLRIGERGEGKFKKITWDEAFTIIAEKLKEIKEKYGPESVVSIDHGQGCVTFYRSFLFFLYGTPNIYDHTAACDATFDAASSITFGSFWPMEDYENSKYIILWGKEPFEAPRIVGFLQGLMEARDRGTKLVVVNPRLSKTAEKADEWIPIRPGTDGAMALAMAKTIIDEELYDREFVENYCYGFNEFREHLNAKGYTPEWAEGITGVPASTIRRISREFATNKPAISSAYHGFACYTNGFDSMRAILILNAITGNLDKPGCLVLSNVAQGLDPPLNPPIRVPEEEQAKIQRPSLREALGFSLAPDLPSCLLPKVILEGKPYPIKAIILSQINPIMSDANAKLWMEAFKALEFSVAIDIYLSETAMYCDLVLPDACYLERYDILPGFGFGAPMVLYSEPSVPPPGEAKPVYQIVKGIAEKMGYGKYYNWNSEEEWMKNMIDGLPFTLEELKEKGFWRGKPKYHKYESRLQTPSGKVEIYSMLLEVAGHNPLPEFKQPAVMPDEAYPFRLISARMPFQANVVTQNIPMLMDIEGENWAEINPKDADKYGIKNGDYIVVESPLDSLTVKAKVTEGIIPGVISVIHGFGFGHWAMGQVAKGKGASINKLIGTYADPISGAVAYNECKVRVRKA